MRLQSDEFSMIQESWARSMNSEHVVCVGAWGKDFSLPSEKGMQSLLQYGMHSKTLCRQNIQCH